MSKPRSPRPVPETEPSREAHRAAFFEHLQLSLHQKARAASRLRTEKRHATSERIAATEPPYPAR